jgi:hypothetical protein
MKADARHFDSTQHIDQYDEAELTVERDGANLIRIEAMGGEEGILYDWGRPGVSLEMTPKDATTLAAGLLGAEAAEDIQLAVDFYVTEIEYLVTLPDYDETDKRRMEELRGRLLALPRLA